MAHQDGEGDGGGLPGRGLERHRYDDCAGRLTGVAQEGQEAQRQAGDAQDVDGADIVGAVVADIHATSGADQEVAAGHGAE